MILQDEALTPLTERRTGREPLRPTPMSRYANGLFTASIAGGPAGPAAAGGLSQAQSDAGA